MNRYAKRLDAIEPAIVAALPLTDDAAAMLRHVADVTGSDAGTIRADAAHIAWHTRGMTEDERIAWVAADAGCTPDELRRDMEAMAHE